MGLNGLGISYSTNKHGVFLHPWRTKSVVRAARCQDQIIISKGELSIVRKVVKSGSASANPLVEVNVFNTGLDVSDFPSLMADRRFDETAASQLSLVLDQKLSTTTGR